MRKITIYSDACNKVEGFKSVVEEFKRKLIINGKAKSTDENYLRQIAKPSMAYERTSFSTCFTKNNTYNLQ